MQDKHSTFCDKMQAPSNLGLYVHVPFCANKCDYCAFYKSDISTGDFDLYLKCVEKEISLYDNFNPETIFIGGGTPSFLPFNKLKYFLELLQKKQSKLREFTIEVSPLSIDADKLSLLKDYGVTRISMGIQSFNEELLKKIGRKVPIKNAYKALDLISYKSFEHFNTDFIFAIDGQKFTDFESDIEKIIKYPIDHISAYCIEYESGTALCAGRNGKLPSEEKESQFVEYAAKLIEKKGFARYEISNYAKIGSECAHNLGTWNMNEWVGIGPSAASQYKYRRYKNKPNLHDWAKCLMENESERFVDCQKLDDNELYLSSLIFGIRMTKGVDLNRAKKRFKNANITCYEACITKLIREGFAEKESNFLRLTKKGLLLADAIALELCMCE